MKKGGQVFIDHDQKFHMINLLFVKMTLEGNEEGKTGVRGTRWTSHLIETDDISPMC